MEEVIKEKFMGAIESILLKLAEAVSLGLIKKGYNSLSEVPTFKKAAEDRHGE